MQRTFGAEGSRETVCDRTLGGGGGGGYDCSSKKAETSRMRQTHMLQEKQEESDTSTEVAEDCLR